MTPSFPPIPDAVRLAYRDLASVARELTRLMIVALVAILATNLPLALFVSAAPGGSKADILVGFVTGLAQTFLLTPFFIAVHRFIILGERARAYVLTPRELRFQLYFTFWAAFSVVAVAPIFIVAAWPVYPGLALVFVWTIAVMIAGLRLTILFPAIAVDAPGATVARALADTKGYAWRIFAIGVIALLPVMAVGAVFRRMFGPLSGDAIASVAVAVVEAVVSTVMMTLFVAIASRLYQWLGDRVNRSD